jgi:hypothetical protein
MSEKKANTTKKTEKDEKKVDNVVTKSQEPKIDAAKAKKTGKKESKEQNPKSENDSKRRNRSFKVIYMNGEGSRVCEGRYCGAKPKQAACKALTAIFKNYKKEKVDPPEEIMFGVCESTRNSKKKRYWYSGARTKLDHAVNLYLIPTTDGKKKYSPVSKINDMGGFVKVFGKEESELEPEISYNLVNVVKKVSPEKCKDLLNVDNVDDNSDNDEKPTKSSQKGGSKKSSDKKSSDKKSSDKKSSDKKSSDKKSSDKKSSDKKSSDKKSSDKKSSDKKSSDAKTSDKKSTDAKTSDKKSTDTKSSDKKSTDTKSSDKKSTDTKSSDKKSTDTKSSDKKSSDTKSSDKANDTKSVDSKKTSKKTDDASEKSKKTEKTK